MNIIIKSTPEELLKAKAWWDKLEMQWKMAFNEACMGKGPVIDPPKDDALIMLITRVDTFRFAGPLAVSPNVQKMPNNLSGLMGLKQITYLSFTHSPITSVKELANLPNLRNLFLYNNKIKSLWGIQSLFGLEDLYCQNNHIDSLEPILRLTNLKTVYAHDNKLVDLKGLTYDHGNKLRQFYIEPNEDLPHRELIRVQNEYGIICRKT